jgi:Flp pilus assembly protein TadB
VWILFLRKLVDNLEAFPEIEMESSSLKSLNKIFPEANEHKYLGACIILSVLLGLLSLFSFLLIGIDIESSAIYSFAFFAVIFAFLFFLPSFELGRRTRLVEAEMPFALRTIGMLRNMNIQFIKCLSMAAEEESEIATELRMIVSDVSSGVTLERAFSKFAAIFSSYPIKRAISQIISAYELGSSGTEMRRIGDELLAVQQHQLRESASRSAIFGMLFIMASAILPTFFLVYALLGDFGIGTSMSQEMTALALLLIFPAICVLLLLVSKASVPYSPLASKTNVIDIKVLVPALAIAASFLISDTLVRIAAFAVCGIVLFWFIYASYKREKRTEEIEQFLPDALFSVSALPKSAKMERIFELIEHGGYGALSEEAAKANRQLNMNVKPDIVLDDLWKRNESPALKKVCIMLKHAYNTNSLDQLHFIAEDLLKNFEIRRERASLMSMQKYTILFGGVIIPLILKIALSLIGSLSQFLPSPEAAADALAYVVSLIPAYLVIYAIISSFYIADIEGRKSRAAIYFLILAVVSILVFNFVSI